jgi:Tfp pilus assembly protein PilX
MSKHDKNYSAVSVPSRTLRRERGAALATSLLVLSAMAAVSMTVLAVVTHEARIAGSDMNRTQTYYATAAGIEKMTTDFSDLFTKTSNPSTTQINNVAAAYPSELVSEGFSFTKADGSPNQSIILDPTGTTVNSTVQSGPFSGMIATITPYVLTSTARHINTGSQVTLQRTINNFLIPIFQFGMFSNEDLEVHPGPAFAFNGRVHANGNLYVSGTMTFLSKVSTANELVVDVLRNGNTHAQSMNVTVNWPTAPIVVPLTIGSVVNGPNVSGTSSGSRGYWPGSPGGTFNTTWNSKSVAAAQTGVANQFGGSVLTRSTGGAPLLLPMQLEGNMTREIIKRVLPTDTTILSGSRYHSKSQVRILIDDEGNSASDAAGIPAGQGVYLSSFNPIPLPNLATSTSVTGNGGGRALWRINDNNTSVATSYNEQTSPNNSWNMQQQNGSAVQADTVRGIKAPPPVKAITAATNANPIKITVANHGLSTGDKVFIANVTGNTNANGGYTITKVDNNNFTLDGRSGNATYTGGGTFYSFTAIPKSSNGNAIPPGSGITGRILIQIVDSNGVARDVTTQVLSMGMTEGEPNAIIYLQRPLWAAFTQGSRDASGSTNPALNGDPTYTNCLTDILTKTRKGADGEIKIAAGYPVQDATYGYLTNLVDDTASGSQPVRSDMPGGIPDDGVCAVSTQPVLCQMLSDWGTSDWSKNRNWNAVVPINVYNIREGRINTSLASGSVYERGITNVIEINMRNFARWADGVFDNNLLQGTGAVSANIASPDGYTVYVSDRRGDDVKSMTVGTSTFNATNGMVDNEDIYGPNGTLDPGEDIQQTGALVKDTNELPDPAILGAVSPGYGTDVNKRAITVNDWINLDAGGINKKMFRSAVRIFNGENLQISGSAGKLSTTKGITISSENMVYIWGNYNTTGIDVAPPAGVSCLNDNSGVCRYLGNQVPTSIVCDSFFPLSKTFFDSQTSLYPDDFSKRSADRSPTVAQETSVRAAIIAGNNLSALSGNPDAGNSASGESRLCGGMHNFPRFLEDWNARWNFVGSLIPLYRSTQGVGQYNADSSIYSPPIRNWAFDITFTNPARLPPGTPFFQHLEPTGFRQVL